MATLKGKDGIIKIGPTASAIGPAVVQSWTLDEVADVTETSGMGADWKGMFATFRSWSGSVECYLDPADAALALAVTGAEVDLDLYPGGEATGATYYSGRAIITGTPKAGAKDGVPTLTINFSGNGPLAKATV